MNSIFFQNRLWLFLFLILSSSCDDDVSWYKKNGPLDVVNLNDPYRGLKNYSYSITTRELNTILKSTNESYLQQWVKYDVSILHFTYTTTFKDSIITASGAIAIPVGVQNPSIMVFHHGTMFYDGETPSQYKKPTILGIFASAGYITLIPDYIGYGTSRGILHPYHIYQPTVNASIDMILQAKEFLNTNAIAFKDDDLFLAGFSEGGYAAFAVQKEIEEHPEYHLTVRASAPGAGAYDVRYQFEITTNNDIYDDTEYIGLALASYNEYYFRKSLDQFFNPPYAAEMLTLLNGEHTEEYIHDQLPNKLSILLKPTFLNSFKNDPTSEFNLALAENSLNNFLLKTPTRFIQGTQDNIVPFAVAKKTYDDLIALGVDPDILKIVPFDGDHDFNKYIGLTLAWFGSFK